MSYLNFPQLHFFGTFRADPSTLNNTPDNFNPNNNFPPDNGEEVGNNIQLYWNPNGTAEFQLDCTVAKIRYADGSEATTGAEDPLIGLSLRSLDNSPLGSGRVVDLDPMQQNVTEIWGLQVGIREKSGSSEPLLQGSFKPSAYSNAWVQVKGGRGDYAGSANFQSVLEGVKISDAIKSQFISELCGLGADPTKLSINFVLRAFNSASQQYLVNENTLATMKQNGVSAEAIAAISPLSKLAQGQFQPNNPRAGEIPTTGYFTKLVNERLTGLNIPQQQVDVIMASAKQPPTPPLTPYEFTWGQVFGTLGLDGLPSSAGSQPGHGFGPAPDFLTPDRMLAPAAVLRTNSPPASVPTDSGPYAAYFAPFKVTQYPSPQSDPVAYGKTDGTQTYVSLNLGNSLLSTQPASPTESFVDTSQYGKLALYCFGQTNKVLAPIDYADPAFYSTDSGVVNIRIDNADVEAVQTQPLGLVNLDANNGTSFSTVFLRENERGLYVRPNQFVYRMNPGIEAAPETSRSSAGGKPSGHSNPGTATVEFYVSCFGRPASGVGLVVSLMPPLDAQTYSNNTLGTGGTSGMVNMSVPESALTLENNGMVTTDEKGIATLQIKASNPGNPRGYMDGQIYFLQYEFQDESLRGSYVQSPDDLVSVQVYDAQPDIKDVTWENFVGPVLEQYGKIYPIMSFINLENQQAVAKNAKKIRNVLLSSPLMGGHMPVTRDLSASRLNLIIQWLDQQIE